MTEADTGRCVASDINWDNTLEEQLEPNLKGGPDPSKSFDDLCLLRKQIPRLDNWHFNLIYPKDNVIRVVQKSHGVHEVKMREVAAWVLNATHWYSLLKQPMMIVISCRDWSDASKFQYLMQIPQVQFQDYVPKYHIFVDKEETVDKMIQHWQEPTTLWDGHPVLGFTAETYLEDLSTIGFNLIIQGLQSDVVISDYLCQSELGPYDIWNGSTAPISRYREKQEQGSHAEPISHRSVQGL